jgi:hypothetical protein
MGHPNPMSMKEKNSTHHYQYTGGSNAQDGIVSARDIVQYTT